MRGRELGPVGAGSIKVGPVYTGNMVSLGSPVPRIAP